MKEVPNVPNSRDVVSVEGQRCSITLKCLFFEGENQASNRQTDLQKMESNTYRHSRHTRLELGSLLRTCTLAVFRPPRRNPWTDFAQTGLFGISWTWAFRGCAARAACSLRRGRKRTPKWAPATRNFSFFFPFLDL